MQFSIKVYERNKKKWGTLNKMAEDIGKTLRERQDIIDEMEGFMTKQMRGLISRKVSFPSIDYKGNTLVIKKEGFALKHGYSQVSRILPFSFDLANFLKENKMAYNTIVSKIRNKQKKDLLEIFVNTVNGYKPKDFSMSLKVKKQIMDAEFRTKNADMVSVRTDKTNVRMTFNYGNEYDSLGGDGWDENVVKEQLYLPFWKLLTKLKRHASKEQKRVEKVFTAIKKNSEPIWVAEQIKKDAASAEEVQA